MVKPLALANAFIDRFADHVGIQHMKLQKLCYYAYGWWLTAHEEPLLDRGPEVWRYGPVFSELYSDLKAFGNQLIPRAQLAYFNDPVPPMVDEAEHLQLVDWIWRKYGKFTAAELSEMTHRPGTPWRKMAEAYNFKVPLNLAIPDAEMRAYFRGEGGQREIA
jgi:uncharacterized phage-associated protein